MTNKAHTKKTIAEIIRRCNIWEDQREARQAYTMVSIGKRNGIASSTVNLISKGWESKSLEYEVIESVRADCKIGVEMERLLEIDRPKKIAADLGITRDAVETVWNKHKLENFGRKKSSKPSRLHWIYTKLLAASPAAPDPAWYY